MTEGASYREFDETQYHQFQKQLLRTKGGQLQREFLKSAMDAEDFVSFLAERVEAHQGETLPVFDGPLTEASFKEPTPDQERRMYELWSYAPPSTACRVSFWAAVTLENIREGKIPEPTWLAANGDKTESGEERIDQAFARAGDEGNKAIDGCVRTVFRRMSGLPQARGNRSVFVNPTFGRGWWRERIVSRILARDELVQNRTALLDVVRQNQQYWENLVTMIVSRGSVFGSLDVQDALINGLAEHLSECPKTSIRNASTLNRLLRRFSNVAASRELGTLEFAEIGEIVRHLIRRLAQSQ